MPRKKPPKTGDFIRIDWEGVSDVEFVRGHVTLEEAQQKIKDEIAEPVVSIRHIWARWVPAPPGYDYRMMLYTYPEYAKGCFPVTEATLEEYPTHVSM